MPDAIEGVESEWQGNRQLGGHLSRDGPGSERRRHACGSEVQADERGQQVAGAEDVERPSKGDACDTMQHGRVPGDLRLVDAQMRGGRAVAALGDEDFVGFGGGGPLRRDGSGARVSWELWGGDGLR